MRISFHGRVGPVLATLSTKMDGLGLRKASKHCSGAFLASSIASNALSLKLDPGHELDFD